MAIPPIRVVIQGVDKFSSTVGKSMAKLQKMGKQMQSIGRTMSLATTLPVAAFGVSAAKTAGEFQRSMARVKNTTKATTAQMAAMEKQARDLGAKTLHSASAAAEGMVMLGQAGFKTNQIMSALPATLDVATLAQIDLGEASDKVSNIMSGYRKSADQTRIVADMLTATTQNTNTNMIQLAEAMSFVAPDAAGAGIAFEDASTILGILADNGIQAARSGTTLRAVIAALQKPTSEAIQVLNKLGIRQSQVFTPSGKFKDFIGMFDLLRKSGASASDLIAIFGRKMKTGVEAVMATSSERIAEVNKSIRESAGDSREAAAAFEEGLLGRTKELASAFEELKLALLIDTGLLKSLTGVVQKLTGFFRRLSKVNPELLKIGVIFAGIIATIGPLLIIMGSLINIISIIGAKIAAAGGIFALLSNPIGWVIAAIVALIAILKVIGLKWQEIWRLMLVPFTPFVAAVEWIISNWQRLVPFFKLLFMILGGLFKAFGIVVKFLLTPVLWIIDKVIGMIKKVLSFGLGTLEKVTRLILPKSIEKKIGLINPETQTQENILRPEAIGAPSIPQFQKQSVEVLFRNAPADVTIERTAGDMDIFTERGTLLPALGG